MILNQLDKPTEILALHQIPYCFIAVDFQL